MTFTNAITKRDLSNLLAHASHDETRGHIFGLFVSPGLMAATDGHRLALWGAAPLAPPYPSTSSPDAVIIPRPALERVLKLAPAGSSLELAPGVAADAWTARITDKRGELVTTLPLELARGSQFPAYDQVLPKHHTEGTKSERQACGVIQINAEYLSQALLYCSGPGKAAGEQGVRVHGGTHALEPVIVRSCDGARLSIVMPMRAD